MRTVKDPEERKSEILDTAEQLFITKGYSQTTILDILNEIGIAKGTFYYYFKSKEEVMDAIISRIVNADVAAAREIADNPNLPAIQKMLQIFLAQKPQRGGGKDKMIGQLHHPDNAEMHLKSWIQSIRRLTPVLTEVIEQGIDENVMASDYPHETMEFLLAAAQIIFDEGLFHWGADETPRKIKAFIHIMEVTLGAAEGSFDCFIEILLPG